MCLQAAKPHGGYCHFNETEADMEKPLKDRTVMTPELCRADKKCYVKDKNAKCEYGNCWMCAEKSERNRCKAVDGCSMRDEEDYELLQTKLSHSLKYHLQVYFDNDHNPDSHPNPKPDPNPQEVVNVPEVATMPPLQLWQRFGPNKRGKMHVNSDGTNMNTSEVLAHNRKQVHSEPEQFDDEAEAASLIHQIPMDFRGSCKRMKKLIRQKGLKRFKELTGLKRPLHCQLSTKQKRDWAETGVKPWALSLKQYDDMTVYMHKRMAKMLEPQLLQWREDEGTRRKQAVIQVAQQSHELEERNIANEKQEDEEQNTKAFTHAQEIEEAHKELMQATHSNNPNPNPNPHPNPNRNPCPDPNITLLGAHAGESSHLALDPTLMLP